MLNTETKRHIDAARDVLVGVAPNPITQIDQITYALIYKFMDDMDQASIKAGGEPSFFLGELAPYAWSKLLDSRMGNQEKMNLYGDALTKFSESKQLPELFRTVFRAAFLPYRSPETLGLFLKEIDYFDYTHPEELGNAYEYLLSIMSSQGDAGQFRTPRHIIDFIVDVVNPSKDDKILDPACGTGGFLVSAYNHILEQHDEKDDTEKKEKPLTPDERRTLMQNLRGYDIDPTMVRIAQVNMYLHQFKNPQIFQYDSLTSEERWNDKFDVILANPPFMTPKGGIKPHNKFSVPSNRAEVLFVDYIISHLRPKGRAGVVVPEGIIFQNGNAYKALRRNLVENGLYAVVSLPGGVFQPYSGVKTSILFIDNVIAKQKNEIAFIKIKADGFDLGANKRPVSDNDLPEALHFINSWASGKDIECSLAEVVSKEQISSNGDYNLSSDRYKSFVDHSNTTWPMVELGDVLEVQNGFAFDSKFFNENSNGIPLIRIRDVNSGFSNTYYSGKFEEKYLVSNGDILVGMDGDFRTTIWTNGTALLNQRVCRLQNFNGVIGKYVYYIIQSELKRIQDATYAVTVKHISSSQIQKITIPNPPLEIQEKIVAELDGYAAIISGAKQIIENWKPSIKPKDGWRRVKLSEVAQVDWGNTSLTKSAYVKDGSYLAVSATGGDGRIDHFEHDKGVTVLSAIGANCGKMFYPQEKFTAIKNTMTLTPKLDLIEPLFLYCSIAINSLPKRGGGQPFIAKGDVVEYEIMIPTLEEQRQIVLKLESEINFVENAKQIIERYEELSALTLQSIWR